jgi:hypothetical protein
MVGTIQWTEGLDAHAKMNRPTAMTGLATIPGHRWFSSSPNVPFIRRGKTRYLRYSTCAAKAERQAGRMQRKIRPVDSALKP